MRTKMRPEPHPGHPAPGSKTAGQPTASARRILSPSARRRPILPLAARPATPYRYPSESVVIQVAVEYPSYEQYQTRGGASIKQPINHNLSRETWSRLVEYTRVSLGSRRGLPEITICV